MKVLRIIISMNPSFGGPCQGIRNSCKELAKLGIENEVVSLDSPDEDFLGKDIFPIYPLGPSIGPWCYSSKLIPWLNENLERYDAVIVHGLWLYSSYAAIKAFRRLKALKCSKSNIQIKIPKLFVMPHGMLDPYFQKAGERRLKAIRNWVYWKLIENKVVNQAEGLLFTCQAELELARTVFNSYQPKREINVGYGILEPPHFTPSMNLAFLEKCPGLGKHSYLLFLSRIHHKKGVDILIEAYRSILIQQMNLGVEIPKLVIAGPNIESDFGQRIQSILAKDEFLNKYVFLPGMLEGDAKWGAFYGCEAFILPSHQENFGIAIVEALACSKPVIISNQVNIWREIDVNKAGLVEKDTQKGIYKMLDIWLNLTRSQKSQMALNARSVFDNYFTIANASRNMAKALN